MRLKRILRENGIPWSPVSQAHLAQSQTTGRRKTRSSMSSGDLGYPHLPMEVILRILKFALTSSHPIIDPLSPLTTANLTEAEKSRGNQVAIHFLATCKALHEEGSRIFWNSNTFLFTTPQAVRDFGELSSEYRNRMTAVTFRIIARYYDDQVHKRKLDRFYHWSLRKDIRLRVHQRPREAPLIRGGFRCYAWNQIVDFLAALRAPYDPSFHPKSAPRPTLLPSLTRLRLDLVNFSDTLLPFSGPEFHDVTSHEFGCTLNELQVTGMPNDDAGSKAGAELSGLLKDEGLYLDGDASFVMPAKGPLHTLRGGHWRSRVVRAWRDSSMGEDSDSDVDMSPESIFSRGHTKIGVMPSAPAEMGPPESTKSEDVIWKRVPTARDSTDRSWVQFSRYTGFQVLDGDSDDDEICPCCADAHPFLGFLDDELHI